MTIIQDVPVLNPHDPFVTASIMSHDEVKHIILGSDGEDNQHTLIARTDNDVDFILVPFGPSKHEPFDNLPDRGEVIREVDIIRYDKGMPGRPQKGRIGISSDERELRLFRIEFVKQPRKEDRSGTRVQAAYVLRTYTLTEGFQLVIDWNTGAY